MPLRARHDAEAGELRKDIPEINLAAGLDLFQGDILLPEVRNGLRDPATRWKFPIPYILADNLGLNAKGVILHAFEMFRLKSCVDFKPYEGESTYIIFQQFGGCWSMVGDQRTGQNLSIGLGCDYKAIVEHELLHALGFYHEQSRTDRDDYVNIWWDEILPDSEHNFVTYNDVYITDLNTPYDYESVMHYAPFSFNKNENVPTITTKIPYFNDIIGQRLDFSAIDLERLNRMYNCTSTHTLLDQCTFEKPNICGMIQSTRDDADWFRGNSNLLGQDDHTLTGRCKDAGYFMHFNTSSGKETETALLESRILYPKRRQQCLQFFYRMTGSDTDSLVIWVRRDDSTGNVRKLVKMESFKGNSDPTWRIGHVALREEGKFRYLFQGTKGNPQNSTGGIFIDDIALTETPCPMGVLTISNFSHVLEENKEPMIRSPCYYSPEGYRFGVSVFPHGRSNTSLGYLSLTFHLCSGENDGILEWPAENRQVIITVVDQDSDVKNRMSLSLTFTTSKNHISAINNASIWDRPSLVGKFDSDCKCFRSIDFGWTNFISHQQLQRRSFLKNDNLIIFVEFEDLTHLSKTEVPVGNQNPSIGGLLLQRPEAPRTIHKEIPREDVSPGRSGLASKRQKRSVENTGPMEDHNWPQYFRDPCDPNPCQNEGICVNVKGMASCRCTSGHAFFYTGERCQVVQVHGGVLGLMIGGVAGSIVMTFAIISFRSRG
ncbi:meprin A subunit alpha [Tachyglossus aculeatus]|uniref:meprin A subunit alpha n=1 Tax=Tachyglossus aculeatus TaxID=9261 RepID=UPI0018F6564A|nr:meprin A subunit alpha [Tachyglossus aculeatus]